MFHNRYEQIFNSTMTSFKKLNPRIFSKVDTESTPDKEYWKKLNAPVLVKEFGPIDYIDFSPVEPYYFAVTCSSRVQVYNPITKLVAKNLSKFRAGAYGATFRSDGRLICAGGEENHIKLFDVNTKSLLRIFMGHTAPVHRTFFTYDKIHITSFSDDKSVKIWDIATEKSITSYSEHNDYIRAGALSPVVPDIILSGSYDASAKMYDRRTESIVLSVDHGSPIESVLFLPSGSIFLTAGGTDIKIWDAIAGGKLLGCVSQHHKTITCLHLASENKRIMSGSLDRHVKIYDVSTFKVVHTLNYPNAVLSLAVSRKDETVVAGMVDGLVAVQRREEEIKPVVTKKKMASYKYSSSRTPKTVDEIIMETRMETVPRYDYFFKKFEYSKALAVVLKPRTIKLKPENIIAVLQELIKRKALHRAFTTMETKYLEIILRFFIKYLTDYRFTRMLLEVIEIFLDVYEDSYHLQPGNIQNMFISLQGKVQEEQELFNELAHIQGSLQLLLSGASASEQIMLTTNVSNHNLIPSEHAQKNLFVNLT